MRTLKTVIDFVMDILETITFVASLFIVIYLFIVQPNQVKGGSMEPTFYSGDYIFTSKITYKFRSVERGDVIVFKSPANPKIEYIKRVIALPGDTVMIKGSNVFVNGQLIEEEYIAAPTILFDSGTVKDGQLISIGDGNLFVMGDNRPRSSDSRDFGPIHESAIIGQVFYRYFPFERMHLITNPRPKEFRSRAPLYFLVRS